MFLWFELAERGETRGPWPKIPHPISPMPGQYGTEAPHQLLRRVVEVHRGTRKHEYPNHYEYVQGDVQQLDDYSG